MTDSIRASNDILAPSASIITNSIPNELPKSPLQDILQDEGSLSEVINTSQQNITTSLLSPDGHVDSTINIEVNMTPIQDNTTVVSSLSSVQPSSSAEKEQESSPEERISSETATTNSSKNTVLLTRL